MIKVLALSSALLADPVTARATQAEVPSNPQPVQHAEAAPSVEPPAPLHLEQVKIDQTREASVPEATTRFPRGIKWWLIAGAIAVKAVILILVL